MRERRKGGLRAGGLAERANDPCRLFDRRDALAPHVPDQEPHVLLGVVAVEQVTPDDRILRRGLVAGADRHLAYQCRESGQDGPLRHLGDRSDACVPLLPAYSDHRDDDRGGADEDHVDDADELLGGAPRVIPPAGGDRPGHGGCGDCCRGTRG